jgi:hypothetical protein
LLLADALWASEAQKKQPKVQLKSAVAATVACGQPEGAQKKTT